jgi:hypothetical protein
VLDIKYALDKLFIKHIEEPAPLAQKTFSHSNIRALHRSLPGKPVAQRKMKIADPGGMLKKI